jgi:class 3 adenylate cyclase
MVDVSRWLAEHGLGHHAEVFAEHGIAGDILRDLTDTDLKELGLNLGDRKRVLKAIAALDPEGAQDRAGAVEPTTTPAASRDAERRQLTVLFCDLVGSTELATRLDPEDLGAVMGAYHRVTAAVIERFDGHVAKYLGDGVLAYFGWPKAHEDDAERAVRAGLGLIGAVARLEPHEEVRLQARVGVATGQVVVGDLVGEGAARDEAVVGETPNLAARLQTLAAPESVVISQATRRLVKGCSSWRTSAHNASRASPSLWPRGESKVRAAPKAASRLCAASISRRWSAASTSSASCSSAGRGPRTATARWCCCRASPGSASRA